MLTSLRKNLLIFSTVIQVAGVIFLLPVVFFFATHFRSDASELTGIWLFVHDNLSVLVWGAVVNVLLGILGRYSALKIKTNALEILGMIAIAFYVISLLRGAYNGTLTVATIVLFVVYIILLIPPVLFVYRIDLYLKKHPEE